MESQRVLGAYKERFRKELPKMNMIAGLVEFLSVFSMFSIQFKTLTFGCKYARWPLGGNGL